MELAVESLAGADRPRRALNLPTIVIQAPAMLYLLDIRGSLPVADG
jgi:hypothetical protein